MGNSQLGDGKKWQHFIGLTTFSQQVFIYTWTQPPFQEVFFFLAVAYLERNREGIGLGCDRILTDQGPVALLGYSALVKTSGRLNKRLTLWLLHCYWLAQVSSVNLV